MALASATHLPALDRAAAPLARAQAASRARPLLVHAFCRLHELAPWREQLRALNQASRRPSPFSTLEYLEAYEQNDEFAVPGAEPLLLAAFRGHHLVGFLPLRLVPERVLGVAGTKLQHFTTHDADRPGLLAAPQDEEECARAFLERVADKERGWTFFELLEQEEGSALSAAASALSRPSLYQRRFPNNPNATLSLEQGFAHWFSSLNNFRSSLARRARALQAAGALEFWALRGRGAARDQLTLYLDLERRSWKLAAGAGIARHPRRVGLFTSLLAPGQEGLPVFYWLLLDGLPVAGMLALADGPTLYQLELAYDESARQHSVGNLMMLLAMREAAEHGAQRVNLLGNFAYHKARWQAQIHPTHAVQLYRRPSAHYFKARAGELRRRVAPSPPLQLEADHNLSKPAAPGPPLPDGAREASRQLAAQVLQRAAQRSAQPMVLSGDSLRCAFPFELRKGP